MYFIATRLDIMFFISLCVGICIAQVNCTISLLRGCLGTSSGLDFRIEFEKEDKLILHEFVKRD